MYSSSSSSSEDESNTNTNTTITHTDDNKDETVTSTHPRADGLLMTPPSPQSQHLISPARSTRHISTTTTTTTTTQHTPSITTYHSQSDEKHDHKQNKTNTSVDDQPLSPTSSTSTIDSSDATVARLLASLPSETRHQINIDVPRTLIHYHAFDDEANAQQKLGRILFGYAMHDKAVGYCQGMNFVAAFILAHMPTELDTYWTFYTLMKREKPYPNLRHMYINKMYRLKLALFEFVELFHRLLPQLFDRFHFQFETQVAPEYYVTPWFATLFTSRNIPVATLLRIWDIFFIDRWKAIHRIGLAILKLAEPRLQQLDFEGTVEYLTRFPDQSIFEPDRLIATAMSFKVTNRMLHELENRFIVELEAEQARIAANNGQIPRYNADDDFR